MNIDIPLSRTSISHDDCAGIYGNHCININQWVEGKRTMKRIMVTTATVFVLGV